MSHLQALTLEDLGTGRQQEVSASAVFMLIGAEPHMERLRDLVALDERRFVLTGRDIPQPVWRARRAPLRFETSVPGVFASATSGMGRSNVSPAPLAKA
jgi:thioredoxin reductase (NADPH)